MRDLLAPYRDVAARPYPDLHAHVLALADAGLLQVIDEPINKDTEMHPLVRWQYRGGIAEAELDGALVDPRLIPLVDDGGTHRLRLVLGDPRRLAALGARTGAASAV